MKAFVFALLAVIGIGFGASLALERYQRTVDSSFVGAGARPDRDPRLQR